MYLYGASGHAKVIIDILHNQGAELSGLFDDNQSIVKLDGYQVLRYNPEFQIEGEFIISIGDNYSRKRVAEQHQYQYGKAIHPSAVIAGNAVIGAGTVIMGNAVINSGTTIGKHVIVNTSASVDHDCKLENYVHISPNVTLCGNVSIGEGTHVGAAAVLIPGVKVGKWAIIGAGVVIIRDVPDGAMVEGNPGRVIKTKPQ